MLGVICIACTALIRLLGDSHWLSSRDNFVGIFWYADHALAGRLNWLGKAVASHVNAHNDLRLPWPLCSISKSTSTGSQRPEGAVRTWVASGAWGGHVRMHAMILGTASRVSNATLTFQFGFGSLECMLESSCVWPASSIAKRLVAEIERSMILDVALP